MSNNYSALIDAANLAVGDGKGWFISKGPNSFYIGRIEKIETEDSCVRLVSRKCFLYSDGRFLVDIGKESWSFDNETANRGYLLKVPEGRPGASYIMAITPVTIVIQIFSENEEFIKAVAQRLGASASGKIPQGI